MKKKKVMPLLTLAMVAIMAAEGSLTEIAAAPLTDLVSAQEAELGAPVADETNGNDATDIAEDEADAVNLSVSDDSIGELMQTEDTYIDSGSASISKMSKSGIANQLNAIYGAKYGLYSIAPSVTAPYSSGAASAEHYKYALASVNLMRQIGGLPGVTLKDEYNTYAQYGAVVLAAGDVLSHTPPCPAGMDSEFYLKGLTGTSRGNICMGKTNQYTMPKFTTSYMQDNRGNNVKIVGHRRWILNPGMGQTGFGYAESTSGKSYSVMYSFDNSKTGVDYDFIAWPASGNFPNTIMSAKEPWSVTLNPTKFKTDSTNLNTSSISVTITAPNGVTKTFSAADQKDSLLDDQSKSYFTVDTAGYGVNNCIIFRPGTDVFGTNALSGIYTVVISGLKEKLGTPASLCYTIDFFNPQNYITDTNPDLGSGDKQVDEAALEAFINRLYQKCLDRDNDSAGMLYWKDQLMSKQLSGAQVAQNFFFSDEMKNKKLTDEQFIDTLYVVMMDRKGDASGKEYWMSLMKNGVGRTGIFAEFAVSPEFSAICKEYGITRGTAVISEGRDKNVGATQFIARLYTKALERTYDVDGLNYWCDALVRKQYTASEIATSQFFHSKEFLQKNFGDSDYVKVLYRTFLGREYDEDGLNYWLFQMRVFGMSRDTVLNEFANSKEFKNIMAQYGL